MAYVAFADNDTHSHDPDTFISKYIWSQDHKVIAIQYGITAISVGIVALVLSLLFRLQLGFPDSFSLVQPNEYYQYVTMHGMIMVGLSADSSVSRRFWKLSNPINVRCQRHGVPVPKHAQLLVLSVKRHRPYGELLCSWWAYRRRLVSLPPSDH